MHKKSTIRVSGRTYTVPSRLIGQKVEARLYADHVDVYNKERFVERLERLRGDQRAQRQSPPCHSHPGAQARRVRPLPLAISNSSRRAAPMARSVGGAARTAPTSITCASCNWRIDSRFL